MKLPLYLAISGLLHVVVALVVDVDPPAKKPVQATLTTIEVIEVPVPPPPAPLPVPVDVQLLDEPAVTAPVPKKAPAKRAPKVAAIEASTTTSPAIETSTGTTGIPTGTEPTGKRSPYLSMRTGGRADLTLPAFRDDLDNAPAGTTPQVAVAKSGQLDDSAGGRKKSNQDVFTAKVERDGSVRLKDSRNLSVERSWNPAKLLAGRFDVTDYLMRKTKNDPYASRKLKFLDETRDERVELGKQWRQQQLQQTTMIMRKNLERAWASSLDMAVRKRALFDLWDEIVEPKAAADQADEVLAEASRAARKAVIGFIRARLPAGSEHAYSDGELVALNAKKQSAATFVPYE